MSHLKLVSDQPTALEKLLLDAAKAEQPSAEHRARLRAVLGIEAPAFGATSAAPKSGPELGKSVGFGKVLVGLAALAIGGALLLAPVRDAERAAPRGADSAPQVPPKPESAPAALSEQPAEEEQPPPAAISASNKARPGRPASVAAEAPDLSEQMRLIEAARSAVAAHDERAASAALSSYFERFPRGSFGQEAMVLRIRALDQAGESTRASALARSFIARFPGSPHVARLKPIAERSSSR
jgi:hypothetical protein